jgi:hypothetical protein
MKNPTTGMKSGWLITSVLRPCAPKNQKQFHYQNELRQIWSIIGLKTLNLNLQ